MNRRYSLLVFLLVLAGCGGSGAMNGMPKAGSSSTDSESLAATAASGVTYYTIGSNPKTDFNGYWITQGPDGAIYYTTFGPTTCTPGGACSATSGNLGRLDPSSGSFVEIPLNGAPSALQFAPDGGLWVPILSQGTLARFTLPLSASSEKDIAIPASSSGAAEPRDLALGPDGYLWFTDMRGRVGKIDPAGPYTTSAITTYAVPNGPAGTPGFDARPWGITSGPDGNLWFADHLNGVVYKLTTAGSMAGYVTPLQKRIGVDGSAGTSFIVPGAGGLFVTEDGVDGAGNTVSALDALNTSGVFTPITLPLTVNPYFNGSDGKLVVYDDLAFGAIGMYRTDTHELRELPVTQLSTSNVGGANGVMAASDGSVWFSCYWPRTVGGPLCLGHIVLTPNWTVFPNNTIDLIRNSKVDTTQLIGIGESGDSGPFTAVSSNPNVVKVVPLGGYDHNFYLVPVGYVRAFVTITDAHHHSETITVNVSK